MKREKNTFSQFFFLSIHFGHEFLTFMVICFQKNVVLSVQRIFLSVQRNVAIGFEGLSIVCKSGLLWLFLLDVLRITCGETKRLLIIEPYMRIYFLIDLSVDVFSNRYICE